MIAFCVPSLVKKSPAGMSRWFEEMSLRGLLLHSEDRSVDIIDIVTNELFFTEQRMHQLNAIPGETFDRFGSDACETASFSFMKAAGLPRTNQ